MFGQCACGKAVNDLEGILSKALLQETHEKQWLVLQGHQVRICQLDIMQENLRVICQLTNL